MRARVRRWLTGGGRCDGEEVRCRELRSVRMMVSGGKLPRFPEEIVSYPIRLRKKRIPSKEARRVLIHASASAAAAT